MVQRNKGLNFTVRYKGGGNFATFDNPNVRANTLIEPAPPPDCELVFEWNGVDTSQFDSSPTYVSGGGDGVLVVTSSAEHGNILRLSGTAGVGAHVAFLAIDPISFPDNRRDLVFEVDLFDANRQGGANQYGGLVVLADNAGDYHAINHLNAAAFDWSSRVDAGDLVAGANGGAGSGVGTNGGFAIHNVRGRKASGSPPSLSSYAKYWTTNSHNGEPRRTGNKNGTVAPFGDATALPSSWNDLACNRWGLCMQTGVGNLTNFQYDILSLKVYLLR